jgi:hypothetical protein
MNNINKCDNYYICGLNGKLKCSGCRLNQFFIVLFNVKNQIGKNIKIYVNKNK